MKALSGYSFKPLLGDGRFLDEQLPRLEHDRGCPHVRHQKVGAAAGFAERKRGRALQDTRQRILKRDNGLCIHCQTAGRVSIATEVDHIVPLFKGGTYADDNLQSLCHACHSDKSARDMGKKARGSIGLDGVPLSPSHHWNK